jgi:hypothetical protein
MAVSYSPVLRGARIGLMTDSSVVPFTSTSRTWPCSSTPQVTFPYHAENESFSQDPWAWRRRAEQYRTRLTGTGVCCKLPS